MHERIKMLRKSLGLTQQEFAEKIGIKRGAVANYEIGRNEPADSVIALICRELHVREDWLRNGNGDDMFENLDREQEITEFIGNVMRDENESFRKRFVAALSGLTMEDWKALEHIADELAKRKTDP